MVDQAIKKRAIHRAKIIQGQFLGLIKAIEQEEYCPDLLERSLAIQYSIKSLNTFLLENHLHSHVRHQMEHPSEYKKAIKELVKIYTLTGRQS